MLDVTCPNISFKIKINKIFFLFSLVEIEWIHQVISEHNHMILVHIHRILSKFFFLFSHLSQEERKQHFTLRVFPISVRRYSLIYTAALASSSGSDRRRM
jgi:hypothetical protein